MRLPSSILLGLLIASPAASATLDLPVRYPGGSVVSPYYCGDVVELQLAPAAARAAHPRGAGRTVVRVTLGLGVASVDAAAAALGGATFEPEFTGELSPEEGEPSGIDFTAFYLVHLVPGTRLEDALDRLRATPGVLHADPVGVLPVSSAPNDSLWTQQAWMSRAVFPRTDIHAAEAWDVTSGDSAVVVAILDTGVLPYHPDLGGNVAGGHGNMYVNWLEANGLPGVDDDGNGFIDDVGGWDFVGPLPAGSVGASGEDTRNPDNDPNDFSGHGTAVAGIIGALTNNVIGMAGVAPVVRLMPLRVAWQPAGYGQLSGEVSMTFAAQAIRYATRMGASVMNCSFSSLNQGGLDSSVTAATRAGLVLVNAAGNFGSPAYLGQREDVVSVAATDSFDVVWSGSVTGPWVDLCADGVGLVSTCVARAGSDSIGLRQPRYLGNLTGTSFSTPQVSGAAALIQARRRQLGLRPLTAQGVLLRLRETTDDISALNSTIPPGTYGTGRLNVQRALTDPPTSTATRAGARTVGPPVILRFNTGVVRVVYATSDKHLVALDGATADTVWVAQLTATPVGNLALWEPAAPAGGSGVELLVGMNNGKVAAVREDGFVLPSLGGAAASVQMRGGVVVADLLGNGQREVVCGGSDGKVYAWTIDGTLMPNFPFDTGVLGIGIPAAGDIDGQPGDEIVIADGNEQVHAIRGDGSELTGWPYAPGSGVRAPVLARLGGPGAPMSVIVAHDGGLAALTSAAAERWTQAFSGALAADPVVADMDGDGIPEIVIATAGPNQLQLRDTSGAVVTRGAWPLTTAGAAAGALVAGPLRSGAGTCIGGAFGTSFVAWDDFGAPVEAFPKPGAAGLNPSLGDFDDDGRTEVAAGSGAADSVIDAFDAGAATWNPALAQWPTVRGDDRRSGSRDGALDQHLLDRIRPARVTSLVATALSTTSAIVRWIETGDDSLSGRAASGTLFYAPFPLDPSNLASAFALGVGRVDSSGRADSLTVGGLEEGRVYWFGIVLRDAAGNAGALSVLDTARTAGQAPATIADLRVTGTGGTSVSLAWTATGDDGVTGRPASYTVAVSTGVIDSAGFDALRLVAVPATVDAGGTETATISGLTLGQRWNFVVRATDHSGTRSRLSNMVSVILPVGGALAGRIGVGLEQRLRPSGVPVTIDWQGAAEAVGSPQSLVIVDLTGRVVKRVALGGDPGGTYNWNGRDGDERLLPAGLYFARLASGAFHAETRLVLVP